MWFKQIQVFQILSHMPRNEGILEEQLEKLEFEPCRANTPMTSGWVAPIDEDDEYLVHSYKSYLLFCLQIEEKVLPTYVIRQELKERVKEIESTQQRKVSAKEKYAIRDEIYSMLLPQAFSRTTRVYAYFDLTNKRLILNTANAKKTEIFTSMLQKTIDNIAIASFPLKNLNTIMTNWLQKDNCPKPFYIEDACILKDLNLTSKVIRFKGQDLFSKSVKLLLQDNYKVEQIMVTWQDRVTFVLKESLNLCTIKYAEMVKSELREYSSETTEEELAANFIIMTETLNILISDLLKIFKKK
jgi:recombination associated protein RdgC